MLNVRKAISLYLFLAVAACGGGSAGETAGQGLPDVGAGETDGAADADNAPRPQLDIVDIGGAGTITVLITPANSSTGTAALTADIQLPYRIAKYPVTVGAYETCVDNGACRAPSERTDACSNDIASIAKDPLLGLAAYTYLPTSKPSSEHLRLPVTCATPAEAEAFCAWMGGRVARAGEWMHAARNKDSNKFPWGDTDATPAQHPAANTAPQPISAYEVGSHPASASWSGAQDFALTVPSELLGPEAKATSYAGRYLALQVLNRPGWLNGWAFPFQDGGHVWAGGQFPATGFRCAWSK